MLGFPRHAPAHAHATTTFGIGVYGVGGGNLKGFLEGGPAVAAVRKENRELLAHARELCRTVGRWRRQSGRPWSGCEHGKPLLQRFDSKWLRASRDEFLEVMKQMGAGRCQ